MPAGPVSCFGWVPSSQVLKYATTCSPAGRLARRGRRDAPDPPVEQRACGVRAEHPRPPRPAGRRGAGQRAAVRQGGRDRHVAAVHADDPCGAHAGPDDEGVVAQPPHGALQGGRGRRDACTWETRRRPWKRPRYRCGCAALGRPVAVAAVGATPNRIVYSRDGETDRNDGPPGSLGTPRTRTLADVCTVPEAPGAGTRDQWPSMSANSAVPRGSQEMLAPGALVFSTVRSAPVVDSTTTLFPSSPSPRSSAAERPMPRRCCLEAARQNPVSVRTRVRARRPESGDGDLATTTSPRPLGPADDPEVLPDRGRVGGDVHDAPGGDGGVATGVERFPQGAAREGERHGGRDERRGADRHAPATPPPPATPRTRSSAPGAGNDVRRPLVEQLAHARDRTGRSPVLLVVRLEQRAEVGAGAVAPDPDRDGGDAEDAAASSSVMPSHSTMTSASR